MRNSRTTRFKKVIRVTPEHYDYICSTKKKKSQAGKLEEIINSYKAFHKEYKKNLKRGKKKNKKQYGVRKRT